MKEINSKLVTITMRDGSVFRGYINIGSCRRLSDFFGKPNSGEFLIVFKASIGESEGKRVYFLNRQHILWVEPNDLDDSTSFSGSTTKESKLGLK